MPACQKRLNSTNAGLTALTQLSQLSLAFADPLEYRLLVSPRARRLTLRVEPGRGLIVTVPKRFPKKNVPVFIEENRAWIEAALAEVQKQTPAPYREWPPRKLRLQALSHSLPIVYRSELANSSWSSIQPDAGGLIVESDPSDKVMVATEIARSLMECAKSFLPERLAEHARTQGLSYKKVQIRGQRTVWGSYSSSGTLSLNYKLLFLKPELVDYVLLHELAHTRCMNHSRIFWQHLESMLAGARALDESLSLAGRDVPPWLELAR